MQLSLKHFLCITPATSIADLNKRQPRLQKHVGNSDMTMVTKILEKKFGHRMPLTLQVTRHVFQVLPTVYGFCDTVSVQVNVTVTAFIVVPVHFAFLRVDAPF